MQKPFQVLNSKRRYTVDVRPHFYILKQPPQSSYCSMKSSLNFLKLAIMAGMSSSAGKIVVLRWKTLQIQLPSALIELKTLAVTKLMTEFILFQVGHGTRTFVTIQSFASCPFFKCMKLTNFEHSLRSITNLKQNEVLTTTKEFNAPQLYSKLRQIAASSYKSPKM